MRIDEKRKAVRKFNNRLRHCTACGLAATRNHVLVGEGNLDATMMFVALSPGEKEDAENRMFIGPSGEVFNRLLEKAGIKREQSYMTNLVKCMLPKNRRPKMHEIESCGQFLNEEISIIGPEFIVPLGYYAARSILSRYHAAYPAARKDFSEVYGRLLFSDNQKIYPLPHPASLLYNPSYESATVEKYRRLQPFLHNCKWYPSCPMKRFYEGGWLERKWIERYCKGDWESCVRYKLEEQGRPHPDWMLPDGSLDEGLKTF